MKYLIFEGVDIVHDHDEQCYAHVTERLWSYCGLNYLGKQYI